MANQVTVADVEGTVISVQRVVGSTAAGRFPSDEQEATPDEPTGEFLRQATGGSFELINYTPGNHNFLFLSAACAMLFALLRTTADTT